MEILNSSNTLFKYKGNEYTYDELAKFAKKFNYNTDAYIEGLIKKGMKQIDTDEESDAQQFKNVFNNAILSLKNAWVSTQIASAPAMDYLGLMEGDTDAFIVDKYKELDEINKRMRDTGKGILGGFKEGDAADVAIGIVNALTSTITTVVPAIATRGLSLVPQIMAPIYTEYNAEKAKKLYGDDTEKAVAKLLENNEDDVAVPLAIGTLSIALERVGIKGINRYILNNAKKVGVQKIASLVLTGNKEGLTEYFQGALNVANVSIAQGDDNETVAKKVIDHMASDQAIEEFLQGFVGGAGISAAGNTINSAMRNEEDNLVINNYINELIGLNGKKVKSKTEDAKKIIDKKIKETEDNLKNFLLKNGKKSEFITDDQSKEIIGILDNRKKLNSDLEKFRQQLNNREIVLDEFNILTENINNEIDSGNKKINEIKKEANKKLLHEDLRTSNAAINKILGLEQKVYKTPQEFLKAYNAKTGKNLTLQDMDGVDGLIVGKEVMINEEVAADNNAVTVGSHELLHAILKSSLTGSKRVVGKDAKGKNITTDLTQEGERLINDFLNELSSKERAIVQKRIDDNYKFNEDGSEKIFSQYAEEYLNAYADAAIKNELSDGLLVKIGKFISKIFNSGDKGYKNLEFKTGADVKAFLKAYVSDRKKGEFRQQFIEMAQEGIDMDNVVEKRSVTSKQEAEITKKVDKLGKVDKDGNNLREKGTGNFYYQAEVDDVIKEIKEQGYLDNLIAAKYKGDKVPQNFVNDVITQLIPDIRGFKPEENDSLFGYLQGRINFRAGDVYKKIYAKKEQEKTAKNIDDRTKEGEVKTQVAAEKDPTLEALETEDLSPAAQARKKAEQAKANIQKTSKFRKALGIETGSETYNRILDSVEKSLITAYAKTENITNAKERIDKIVEMIRKEYTTKGNFTPIFKNIKNLLSEGNYINNLKEYKDIFIKEIKTADLVQMLREAPESEQFGLKFIKQLTSKAEVENYVNLGMLPKDSLNKIDKGQAVNLYEKTKPTDEKIVAFADKPPVNPETGKRSGLKGTRKDNFAKRFQQIMIDDAIMQVRQSEKFKSKIDEKTQAENDVELLASAIDKDPNVKFSYTKINNKKFDAAPLQKRKLAFILKQIIDSDKLENKLDKGQVKTVIKTDLNKIIQEGKKISQADQDIIAQLAYAITIDRRYSRPVDDKIFNYLLEKIIAAKKKNINLNAGMAYQNEVVQIFKKYFPRATEILTGKGVKGDLYVDILGVTFGFETKLGLSQAVSQTVNYTKDDVNFSNPNTTKDSEGNVYDDKIKDIIINNKKEINDYLEENDILPIEDFSKPLTPDQVEKLAILKPQIFKRIPVDANYVRWHYMNGKYAKSPQGVMIFENKMYRLVEDVKDKHSTFINKFKGEIPLLELKDGQYIEVGIELVLYKNDKGETTIKTRVRPYLDIKKFKPSKVDITESSVMNNVVGSLKEAAEIHKKSKSIKASNTAINNASTTEKYSKTSRGMSTFDFDETLIDKGENFIVAKKGDNTIKISSGQWPVEGPSLAEQGYEFDFSDFINVRGGVEGPLLQKMRNQIKKFGPSNVFVLTARPPQSAEAIHGWLKSKGITIPLENITGLGNSTGEAKALWMLEKFAEGYNDMYFVDDALSNVKAVKNVLNQLDIKSKVQQAKTKFSKSMNNDFNDILEDVTGIQSKKRFSDAKARKRGQGKGRFRFFVPPSHEDFVGVLYNFIGKGEKGNKHRDFFEKALIQPLNKAYRQLNEAKQAIANDYRNLIKQMPDIRKKVIQKTPDGDYTYGDAVRVYLWDKAGFEVPGLTKTDKQNLIDLVEADGKLKQFADKIGEISRIDEGYIEPSEHWIAGDIRQDLADATGRVGRKKFFAEFIENADIIFSAENINKIRAAFGDNFVEALQDMLSRTKTGTNRKQGSNRQVNSFLDYLNGSIGATMFFNARSAVLQTLSTVNFINFADNNIFKAAAAFANQKQFWSDFAMLFNSDFLKQRRAGVGFDVNGAEIASAVAKSKEPVKAAIAYILNKGFIPTQMADSFAIALGGASMYRNRVNTYVKQGFSQKEAETKAFEDFQSVAESTQQSARPDMISQQQASVLGRMILAFQNVTSQYVRLIKKAGLDLINRRKTPPYDSQVKSDMSNISKIIYYGAVQNLIFYSLQSALFAMAFEDDEEEDAKNEKFFKTKKQRLLNGSIDSILRGMGVGGAVISVLKNAVIKYGEQNQKGWGKKLGVISDELLQLSPPVGIKLRKLDSFERTMEYNKKVIPEMDKFDIDNPMWDAYSNLVEGLTNVPVARLLRKVENVRSALESENAWWQRVALGLGWSKWELGIEDAEVQEVKNRIKNTNKQINKETKLKEATPKEKIKIVEKSVFDLNKAEQVKILNANNLDPKKYPKEADRVKAIMNLRKNNEAKIDSTINAIENYVPTKEEQRSIDLFKMNKKQQVDLLMDLGLSVQNIKKLKYEEDRVKKIIQLQNRSKK